MLTDEDIEEWLEEQPLGEPVDIEGEAVYLNVLHGGAELGAVLMRSYTYNQLRRALRYGFSSALEFDAGLALSPDGKDLVLTQWLPDARAWSDAAQPLEKLLNQLASWRATLGREDQAEAICNVNTAGRNEQRLRKMLSGNKR